MREDNHIRGFVAAALVVVERVVRDLAIYRPLGIGVCLRVNYTVSSR